MDVMASMSLLILRVFSFHMITCSQVYSLRYRLLPSELGVSKLWPISFTWPTRSVVLISGLFAAFQLPLFFVLHRVCQRQRENRLGFSFSCVQCDLCNQWVLSGGSRSPGHVWITCRSCAQQSQSHQRKRIFHIWLLSMAGGCSGQLAF